MIDNEFVPYKEALKLIELGYNFDAVCYHRVDLKGKPIVSEETAERINCLNHPAILYQQAFRWFEENHQIFVERVIETNVNEIMNIDYKIKSWRFIPKDVIFENPYDCFDKNKAELICLKKLIEIANNLEIPK